MYDEFDNEPYAGEGPVYDYFGNYLGNEKMETRAVSEKKAKSNMLHNIKKKRGLAPDAYLRWDCKIWKLTD